MTPKEKANELVDRFDNIDVLGEEHNGYIAQQCALIVVDEIINQDKGAFDLGEINYHFEYWWNVKEEIEKL